MFEVYWLTDEGFEMSLGHYTTLEEADDASEAIGRPNPHTYILVREV